MRSDFSCLSRLMRGRTLGCLLYSFMVLTNFVGAALFVLGAFLLAFGMSSLNSGHTGLVSQRALI